MANLRTVFFIGVVGGLVGYACGAVLTPTRAVAQQLPAEDAGPPPTTTPPAEPPPVTTTTVGTVPQPACHQWEVKGDPRIVYTNTVLLEEGWEPFSYYGGGGTIMMRRCVR